MKTLVINSGSSSVKYTLFNMPNYEVECDGIISRIGLTDSKIKMKYNGEYVVVIEDIKNHEVAIEKLLELFNKYNVIKDYKEINKIGHRVVQGGELFKESVIIDDKIIEEIDKLKKLAPLHNGAHVQGMKVFKKLLPDAINVAVFDTVFHQSMPRESYLYPVPYSWYEKYNVRKYGMHGTSHKYVSERIYELEGNQYKKIINCHLGAGASICAIKDGKSLQTSMGITPLAGIMMGTRSGDIDPSIIEYIHNETNMDIKEITRILNHESGALGISQETSDFMDIENGYLDKKENFILTMDLYVTRIVEVIGSYYFRLKGADVITFTAGVGENSDVLRKLIINKLEFLGIKIDDELNANRKIKEKLISTSDSNIKVYVIPTEEEYQIAKEIEMVCK